MIIFSLDTNFVIPRIMHEGKRNTQFNQLDYMLLLEKKGLIKICLPDSTQAEIYAVLRAGRYPIKSNGKKIFYPFPHEQIMRRVRRYSEIFDMKFLESFKEIDFKEGVGYKEVLFRNMKYILGMDIHQSIEWIENRGIDVENYKDDYDFHIMVATLQCNADYLVTNNIDDFPNPLGKCEVITSKELPKKLPIYP
ncbi:hypothetical protein [Ammoniphilus sp. YIM 78166]|uniref:hypothetical protein n=1 Tax=Ammoniphilus sp. YIM 78166 TaxID=1644106 RepID=UPI0010700EDF|nr:hypothetical protein [Ammoniphilus sp. YIM 78166]